MKNRKQWICQKLTSRKMWMAIALFVSGCMVTSGKDRTEAEAVAGLIMQGAAVVAYIVGEGLVDAGRENKEDEETDAIGFAVDDED